MHKRTLSLFILAFLTISCSIYQINSEEVGDNLYASKKSPQDVVYLKEITRPFEIIGYITVNTERQQDMKDVIEKMKKEAAVLGADAITNIQVMAPGTWRKLPFRELTKNGYVRANFTAAAVVFQK